MTDTLDSLLKQSFQFCGKYIGALLIVSVTFTIILTGTRMLAHSALQDTGYVNPMNNVKNMEELTKRIEEGDDEAAMDIMKSMGMMDENGELNDSAMETMAMGAMKSAVPILIVVALIGMLLSIVTNTYFVVLTLDPSLGISGAFSRTFILLPAMLGVWIWSFLRSFAWIPLIGIIPAIIIGPRLMMGSVILAKERTGVFESVRLSYQRSAGYWGKIVGNCIVVGLLMMIVMMLVSVSVNATIGMQSTAAAFISGVVQYLFMAFGAVFYVYLSETVMANPLATSKK